MKKFTILTTLLLTGRTYDVYTTYLYTPDLTKETNPFVSWLGLSWTGLVTIQLILVGLILYCLWIYCFKKVKTPDFDKDIKLTEFISLFNFGDTKSFNKLFYKPPANKNAFTYSVGYIVTMTIITISFIVGISTTFLITNLTYRQFYREYKGSKILWATLVVLLIAFTIKFYKVERQKRIENYSY